jgi:hypothetical protein
MTHRQPQGSAIIDRGTGVHLPPERLLAAMHWPNAASKCKCESRYEQHAKSKHCNSARVMGRQFNLARFSKSGNSLVPKWRARPGSPSLGARSALVASHPTESSPMFRTENGIKWATR